MTRVPVCKDVTSGKGEPVRSEEVRVGMKVRVGDSHRIAERRGMAGRIVGCYGGERYMAVDVRFPDGGYRLFWPEDLEEISSSQPWWRSLLRRSGAQ